MSRSRAMRPLIKYSLCPERYSRRLTTTSPGFVAGTGLSSAFFFLLNKLLNLPPPSEEASAVLSVASICVSGACAAASARNSLVFGACSDPVAVTSVFDSFVSSSPAAVSITNRAASASSGSSIVMVTSARPIGGRLVVPLKIQSAMRSARSDLWLCSPKTQEMASTTFDLPQPLGPTIHVVPEPLNVTTVRSQNDLKPTISTFRSFSKCSSFSPASHGNGPSYLRCSRQEPCLPYGPAAKRAVRDGLYSSRGGFFGQQVSPEHTGTARSNVWQVLGQRPSRLAQGWRYAKKH